MTGFLIAIIIVVGTARLFKKSLHRLFEGVPEGIDLQDVSALLETLPGVALVDDSHVWAMGTSQIALTAPLVMPEVQASDAFLREAARQLHHRFGIEHVTLQVVRAPLCSSCASPRSETSA